MIQTNVSRSPEDDTWGRDPSIQSMRRVFAMMEKGQTEILAALFISPLDQRLRRWRQSALHLFEQKYKQTTDRGSRPNERQMTDLYCDCFVSILGKDDIPVSSSFIPPNEEVK